LRNGADLKAFSWNRKGTVMMGETTITHETREKVRKLCSEAGVPDKSPELKTEETAQEFMRELQARMQERAPDTI
jgi:hypothetical protein